MATVKFLLQSKSKSAPVYCRLSIGRGNTPTRKTSFSCDPQNWSKTKGLPIAKDEATKELKSDLNGLSTAIINRLNSDQAKGEQIDGQWLEDAINAHFGRKVPEQLDYLTNYADHFIKNLPYRVSDRGALGVSEATLKKYKTILTKLREFEAHKGKRYLIKEVDLKLRGALIKYLAEVDGLGSNTVGRYIKFVKSFVLDARKNGFEANPQIEDFKGFTVKAAKVTLSFDELDTLQATTFEDEVLEAAKDWLIIGCYTGQRVSDLLRMNTEMIRDFNGFGFIVLTQKKTGKTVQIPLHGSVREILDKRSGQFPPVFSNNAASNATIFNLHIKTVCRLAGIDQLMEGTLYDEETKRSKEGVFPKYKLVSSHTCRRSFATNFYADQKYPTPLLMNITAHSTEKMFLEYIGKEPMDYSLQLAETWAKEAAAKQGGAQLEVVRNVSNN